MKICSKCDTEKSEADFYTNRADCKDCNRAKVRSWNKANPLKRRANRKRSDLKNLYGLTEAQFEQMKVDQKHECKICYRKLPLVIDHDHVTGKIRGLLCNSCNRGIGYLQDNEEIIKRAAEYVIENS